MPKRLARKPSTASLTPAAANSRNAMSIWSDAIAHTTTGTSKMRASVIRLGMLKRPAPAAKSQLADKPRAPPCQGLVRRTLMRALRGPRFRRRADRMNDKRNGLTYADSGVDIDAGNRMVELIKPLVRATARPGADAEIGGFGGIFDLKRAGFKDPVLVAGTDGVGTKVLIAIEIGRHETIGIDLVAMSVNDLVVQGAEPLFFLDYFATGKLTPEVGAQVVKGIAVGCREARCALIGGETAEMPGLYKTGDYDLAGFAVGAVERDAVLPRAVAAGDIVLGLASSGLHSNGFSLARKVVDISGVRWNTPCPFATGDTLGEAMLAPTRIYVRSCLAAIREVGGVKALAHITGGGFTENIPRVLPEDLAVRIDLAQVPVLPVFKWLAKTGGIAEPEMLRTFNCGIGMIAVVDPAKADAVEAVLKREGESVARLGEVVVSRADSPRVLYGGHLALS